MTTITTSIYQGKGEWTDLAVEVRFTKRELGGWAVVRADNGRHLGWLFKLGKFWEARTGCSAFRGDSIDDEGHVLDEVPLDLFMGLSHFKSEPVDYGETREEAAEGLLRWLYDHKAPAVGFGRHPRVTPWTK